MSLPGIAIAVDVDNLLISSAMAGQSFKGYNFKAGFDNMFAWISEFAEIQCTYLYMPPSRCIINDEIYLELWNQYKKDFAFEIIYCPRKISEGKIIDDVDQHIIDHTEKLAALLGQNIKYFCLASGDLDYSPLLWDLKRKYGLDIAFVIGSESSFSGVYRQMNLAAKHPVTKDDLIHYFLPRTINE